MHLPRFPQLCPAQKAAWPCPRILPFHDADARPADGILQRQAQQRPRGTRGCGAPLLLLLAILLSLPLGGAGRGDGGIASAAHQLGLPGSIDGSLPGQGCPWRGDVLWGQPCSCIGIHVGVSWTGTPIVGTCRGKKKPEN